MRKRAAIRRRLSPAEAVRFRQELVSRLGAIAPQWSAMSDADLSKLLVARRITTATGLRFDPDRVREFRRSLAKVEAENPYGYSNDIPAVAEKMRLWLLAILTDCKQSMSDERHAEIDKQLTWIALTLLEDAFANHSHLHNAHAAAERAFARTGSPQIDLEAPSYNQN